MWMMFYGAGEFKQVLCWDTANKQIGYIFTNAKGGSWDSNC